MMLDQLEFLQMQALGRYQYKVCVGRVQQMWKIEESLAVLCWFAGDEKKLLIRSNDS